MRRESPQSQVIYGIDMLRFLCAVMVLLYHLSYRVGVAESTPWRITRAHHLVFPWAEGFTSLGWVGVEIFFVISGFVITYSAVHSTAASFLRGRVLRLAPAAWICASITLPIALLFHNGTAAELLAAWLRSVTFDPFGDYIDSVYWTLGIECVFYAIVFVLLCRGALRYMEWLFLGLSTASAMFCAVVFLAKPELQALADQRLMQLTLLVHVGEFATGIFLYGLLFQGFSTVRVVGLAVSIVAGSIETTRGNPLAHDELPALLIWYGAIGAIVLSVVYNGRIAALLSEHARGTLRSAGLATYPLYLIHQVVGAALMALLLGLKIDPLACLLLTMLAMIALAHWVAVALEPRIRAKLKPLLQRVGNATRTAGEAPQ